MIVPTTTAWVPMLFNGLSPSTQRYVEYVFEFSTHWTPSSITKALVTDSQRTQSRLPGRFPYQHPPNSTTSTIEREGGTERDSGFREGLELGVIDERRKITIGSAYSARRILPANERNVKEEVSTLEPWALESRVSTLFRPYGPV